MRFALVLRLFVFTVSFLFVLPLCLARNLYPFDVMTSCSQVCYHAQSGGGGGIGFRRDVLYRLLWWACATACVCVARQGIERESSKPACPGRLPSKCREHHRTTVFCQSNKHRICIVNFWLLRPRQKKKKKSQWNPPWILIWSCFMVAQLHDWNRFSAQNSLVKVNYKGYWNDGRCHDCHYIFFSHSELCCMKMINECLFINWCVCRKEGSKSALHS